MSFPAPWASSILSLSANHRMWKNSHYPAVLIQICVSFVVYRVALIQVSAYRRGLAWRQSVVLIMIVDIVPLPIPIPSSPGRQDMWCVVCDVCVSVCVIFSTHHHLSSFPQAAARPQYMRACLHRWMAKITPSPRAMHFRHSHSIRTSTHQHGSCFFIFVRTGTQKTTPRIHPGSSNGRPLLLLVGTASEAPIDPPSTMFRTLRRRQVDFERGWKGDSAGGRA